MRTAKFVVEHLAVLMPKGQASGQVHNMRACPGCQGTRRLLRHGTRTLFLCDSGVCIIISENVYMSICATTRTAAGFSTSVQGRRLLLQGLQGVRGITPRLCTEQASCPRDRQA